jgi:hypothetical protein
VVREPTPRHSSASSSSPRWNSRSAMGYCQSRETRVSIGNYRKALTDADQAAGIQPRMSRTRFQLEILDFQAAALERRAADRPRLPETTWRLRSLACVPWNGTRFSSCQGVHPLGASGDRGRGRRFEDRRRAQKVRRSFGREGAVNSSKLRPTPTGLPRFRARKNSRNPGASDTYLNAKRDVGVCPLNQ